MAALADGGLLLAVPGGIVLIAGVLCIRKRLSADRTAIYWVRAGAVSGLAAAAVQSVWETGLRRPANTLLFAVLAAIFLSDKLKTGFPGELWTAIFLAPALAILLLQPPRHPLRYASR